MCGFLAIVSDGKSNISTLVKDLSPSLLAHRGPDNYGHSIGSNYSFHHWRLAIVDEQNKGLSAQPIDTSRGTLLFNGEIFNYREISSSLGLSVHSDTELLYNLLVNNKFYEYENELDGFYSFVFLSKSNNSIIASRDYLGQKPLFYTDYVEINGGRCQFIGSSAKSIAKLAKLAPSDDAIISTLLFKDIFNGLSAFSNIYELPPGATLISNPLRRSYSLSKDWEQYYKSDYLSQSVGSSEIMYSINTFEKLLENSLATRTNFNWDYSAAYSGGVDSALLISMLSSMSEKVELPKALLTITFEEADCDESNLASYSASLIAPNIKHELIHIPTKDIFKMMYRSSAWTDQPLAHPHYLSVYRLGQIAKSYGKVIIGGEGSDDLFCGYAHHSEDRREKKHFAFRPFMELTNFAELFPGKLNLPFIREYFNKRNNAQSLSDIRDLEIKTHLKSLLARNDQMFMASSVEARAPFLGTLISKYALRIDPNCFISPELKGKSIVKELLLSRHPAMSRVVHAPKNGFRVPFDHYCDRYFANDYDAIDTANHAIDYLKDRSIMTHRSAQINLCDTQLTSRKTLWALLSIGCFIRNNTL